METAKECVRGQKILWFSTVLHEVVEGFSKIAAPMTKLIRKDVKYDWVDACQKSFDELKGRLTSTPVLALPNGRDEFVVYMIVF